MDDKQKINCTVENCKYNDYDAKECLLKAIVVEPCTQNPDDQESFEDQSMCGSFVMDEQWDQQQQNQQQQQQQQQ